MTPQLCFLLGGVAMCLLWVPFTLAHGPTSFNEERVILGSDMHRWGLLLGFAPSVLIAIGLWQTRVRMAAERKATLVALTVICAALIAEAAFDLYFLALGPPFTLFVMSPAAIVTALSMRSSDAFHRKSRFAFAMLALAWTSALGIALVPLEVSDGFGGYRIYGVLAHGAPGLIWAQYGLAIERDSRGEGS